jgi:putative ABC transport system permease protein
VIGTRPPLLPIRLLEGALGSRAEAVVGDLVEEWSDLRSARGARRADAWLWLQAVIVAARLGRSRLRGRRDATPTRREDGMIEVLKSDVRYGARMLGRSPAFAAVAVLTLALGIGANTAIFSIVNTLLVQPLPLPESERLVTLGGRNAQNREIYFSYPAFQHVRSVPSLEVVSAFVPQSVNLTGRAEPTRVRGGFVSDDFFRFLRVEPAIGRGFVPGQDDVEGASRVCVVQHETWQGLLGADPGVLGKSLVLNNESFTIVGVMPPGFRFPFDEVEVWMPFRTWPPYRSSLAGSGVVSRTNPLVAPLARLRPGATPQQASAELATMLAAYGAQFPEAPEKSGEVRPLREAVVGDARLPLLVLMAAVALVLLIACANVANLMLARAATRQRELATRVALGAGRGRLVRQLLTETGLLWMAGCAAGLVAGHWGLRVLTAAAPQGLPGGLVARLDGTVVAYALGLTALTAVLFGLVPALRFSRPDVIEALKEGGRSDAGSAVRTRVRGALVVSQVALAMVLLVGAGLLLRSLDALTRVSPGFEAGNLLTMEYRLPANKYPQGPQQWEFHRQVVERVRALPGVRSATVVRALPFSGNGSRLYYDVPDKPAPPDNLPRAWFNAAETDSFTTMGIPLLRGRGFDARDTADSPPVVVVSQRMVDLSWPGQDPIGKKLRVMATPPLTAEVVGVVGDIKHSALDEPDLPYVYAVQSQQPHIFNTLVARTEGDPMDLAAAVRGAVWSVDRDQPVWKIRTQESLVEASTGFQRFVSRLLAVYSVLALTLAAVGIYGLMAYSVAQRTREIGLRMALGAHARDVLGLMLRDGLRLTALGVALGLPAAFGLTRLMRSMLFGTSPADPATFAAVAVLLLVVAGAASYVPAWRATRVDPLVALHHD